MLTWTGMSPSFNRYWTRGRSLKISIDSAEQLEDVLRVIGALYEVTLTIATVSEAGQAAPASRVDSSAGTRAGRAETSTGKTGRGQPKKRIGNVSTAELRSWAQENGHAVSDRGPIPAAVSAAYRLAQRG